MNKKIILATIVLGLMCASLAAAGFLDSITGLFSLGVFRTSAPAQPAGGITTTVSTQTIPSCTYVVQLVTGMGNDLDGKTPKEVCQTRQPGFLPVFVEEGITESEWNQSECKGLMLSRDTYHILTPANMVERLSKPRPGAKPICMPRGSVPGALSSSTFKSNQGVLCCAPYAAATATATATRATGPVATATTPAAAAPAPKPQYAGYAQ